MSPEPHNALRERVLFLGPSASPDKLRLGPTELEKQWIDYYKFEFENHRIKPAILIGLRQIFGIYGLLVGALGRCPWTGQAVSRFSYTYGVVTYFFFLFGMLAGYHRLFCHKTYTAHPALKRFLLICGAGCVMGPALRWVWLHRVHHRHSDTDADPHNRTRGWWFSHMGWIFNKKSPAFLAEFEKEPVLDLLQDEMVMWQMRNWIWLGFLLAFILPTSIGALEGGAWTAFLVAGAARDFVVWNAIMFVNSSAHDEHGVKPFGAKDWSVQSIFVSLVACGEGWHDWHHLYAWDAYAAEKHWLVQYNPTAAFIDFCEFLGLVTAKKRATKVWEKEKKKKLQATAIATAAAQ